MQWNIRNKRNEFNISGTIRLTAPRRVLSDKKICKFKWIQMNGWKQKFNLKIDCWIWLPKTQKKNPNAAYCPDRAIPVALFCCGPRPPSSYSNFSIVSANASKYFTHNPTKWLATECQSVFVFIASAKSSSKFIASSGDDTLIWKINSVQHLFGIFQYFFFSCNSITSHHIAHKQSQADINLTKMFASCTLHTLSMFGFSSIFTIYIPFLSFLGCALPICDNKPSPPPFRVE